MAGAQAANDDIERFGKLFAEAADPLRASPVQEHVPGEQGCDKRNHDRRRPQVIRVKSTAILRDT